MKNGGNAELRRRQEVNLVLIELSCSGLLAVPLLQILNVFLHRDVLAGLVLFFHVRLFRIGLAGVDEWIVLIGLAKFTHRFLPSSRLRCWLPQVSDLVKLRAQEGEFEATISCGPAKNRNRTRGGARDWVVFRCEYHGRVI